MDLGCDGAVHSPKEFVSERGTFNEKCMYMDKLY